MIVDTTHERYAMFFYYEENIPPELATTFFCLEGSLTGGDKVYIVTDHEAFRVEFRSGRDVIEHVLNLEPEDSRVPEGLHGYFDETRVHVLWFAGSIEVDRLQGIIAHESLHLVQKVETLANANFCKETMAYMLQDVVNNVNRFMIELKV